MMEVIMIIILLFNTHITNTRVTNVENDLKYIKQLDNTIIIIEDKTINQKIIVQKKPPEESNQIGINYT